MSRQEGDVAALLRRVFLRAVRTFDVAAHVRARLGSRPRGRILAVGKAAATMVGAAWDESATRGLVIVPDGTRVAWASPAMDVRFASHPDPDGSSLAAGEAALAFASRGIDLALISGGASSLMVRPAAGLTFDAKRGVLREVARSGAPIRELNLVRRHLSSIKGGNLARASASPIATLILSDVLGGAPHDIGSGPTVADPSTCDDAREVLARLGLSAPLSETWKPEEARLHGATSEIVAGPDDFADHVASLLEDEGLEVHRMPSLEGDVLDAAQRYIGMAGELTPGQAVVRAAEPTLALGARHGRGGRSTHLAAVVGPRLASGVAFLCGASDGVDGSSGGAGAVVTVRTLRAEDAHAALARFDTGRLHRAAGSLIDAGGPTGLNLCDVHVLARAG